MPFDESRRADFESALGESFGDSVCPPVPFDAASAHECLEALRVALGSRITPEAIAALRPADFEPIASAFGDCFECEPPAVRQIADAVERALARWPADA